MAFRDEIRRKRQELEERELSINSDQAKSKTDREEKIVEFRRKADPLIDGLLKTFFAEAYPGVKWKVVNEIPCTGAYTYRSDIIKVVDYVRYQPLLASDLRAFKVSTSKSTFVIRLDYSDSLFKIKLIGFETTYASGEKRSAFELRGGLDMEELAYIDEMVYVEMELKNEGVQKALERLLLATYEREHIESFLGTKKKNG